ncbi:ABC transporter permease [Streptococcus sp. 27098_8_75]|jgi:putative membrane protein|uniref:ABC transporter permease n=1 Tax=Streptococcus TaxID=1301 RepID=UPI0005F31F30|nr:MULTISPECIES: ABC transporter permease [Streptococcus]ALD71109.1 multidrug ABC transporter permease [Streptococcus gordonii]KJU98118.1 ABC-2 family transporter protein [Streptococcus gordonii]MCC3176145.1 ABC-2 transporter family protein [Streptococcus gordonii]MCY7132963.1 ABC transporter permease [Streptococcus gordonii]MCY7135350.1 ABC transporter permease [Streptococcus gordonii]
MSNKLKGMIWLRGQVTLANKSILLQVLMPVFFVFLYKFIFSLNGAGQELGADRLATLLMNISLPFSLAMSVGTPIIIILAEEREKHNLQSLRLAGVTAGQYILSALIWPAIIGIFYIVVTPILIGAKLSNQVFSYGLVLLLTLLVLIFFFLMVGLFCKNQVMAQSLSVPAMLLVAFIPMFSNMNEDLFKVLRYSFLGLFTIFMKDWSNFQFWSGELLALVLWLLLFAGLSFYLMSHMKSLDD